jgi:hypothetical protein
MTPFILGFIIGVVGTLIFGGAIGIALKKGEAKGKADIANLKTELLAEISKLVPKV